MLLLPDHPRTFLPGAIAHIHNIFSSLFNHSSSSFIQCYILSEQSFQAFRSSFYFILSPPLIVMVTDETSLSSGCSVAMPTSPAGGCCGPNVSWSDKHCSSIKRGGTVILFVTIKIRDGSKDKSGGLGEVVQRHRIKC